MWLLVMYYSATRGHCVLGVDHGKHARRTWNSSCVFVVVFLNKHTLIDSDSMCHDKE